MNHSWIRLVAFICTVFASSCSAQFTGLPVGWSEARPPAQEIRDGNSLACANYSRHEWKVISTPRGLQVVDDADKSRATPVFPPHFVLSKEMRGRAVTLKTSDGWLVGFDAGEFGGGLWWSSEDGRAVKHLLEENVHALIAQNGIPLVLTGLAHMGDDHGAIYAYHAGKKEAWGSLLRVADLGSSPGAASLSEDGTLFVVTHKNIVRFGTANELEPLYVSRAFSALYPNSIVTQKDGRLFVGMRFYVLELLPDNHDLHIAKWFVTPECRTMRVKDFDCVCTARNSH
jgi:hypothetical protein